MNHVDQLELFNLGAKKTLKFLIKFDWEGHNIIRSN